MLVLLKTIRKSLIKQFIARIQTIIVFVEEYEDTKEVIRIRKSKNRQHNGQKKVQKDKQRSTKHTYKTKDRVTRAPLKTGGELMCSGRVNRYA